MQQSWLALYVILTFTPSTSQRKAASSLHSRSDVQGSRSKNRDVRVKKQYSGLAEERVDLHT